MRVSAVVVGESKELVNVNFISNPHSWTLFIITSVILVAHPDYLPANAEEKYFDTVLAGLCVGYATERHAGTKKECHLRRQCRFTDGT
ncbi:glutamate mutase L [Escherichia coli]